MRGIKIVILNKLSPNFQLSMSKLVEDNIETKFYSFYSAQTTKQLIKLFKQRLKTSYKTPCQFQLKLCNTETGELEKTIIYYHDIELIALKVIIIKYLMTIKEIVDTKHTRFCINIQNKTTRQIDTKTISFNSKLCMNELIKNIKKDFVIKIEKIKKEDVVFEYQQNVKTTHYITLRHTGTLSRRKTSTKSFGVNLPNHSSQELIELLRGKK